VFGIRLAFAHARDLKRLPMFSRVCEDGDDNIPLSYKEDGHHGTQQVLIAPAG